MAAAASSASSAVAILGGASRPTASGIPASSPFLALPPLPPRRRRYTSLLPEFAYMLPCRDPKARMFVTKTPVRIRSASQSMTSGVDAPTALLEGDHRTVKQLPHCRKIALQHDSIDKIRPTFSFPKTFFMANASMLVLPFKALAETCEPDNSIFNMNMPLLFAIALVGATVGGLLARQRKAELAKLNDQLRQINAALRRQAKIESYAPNLSYAPVGRVAETEVIVDPRKEQLIANLRAGKNYLRSQDLDKAFAEFKTAFELAQSLEDHLEEKKAARGLGASLQRQGKYREAIKYHSKVLEIAKRSGEDSGSTEAYGAIADCYTELGDLEKAGKFYDKYIARLETD